MTLNQIRKFSLKINMLNQSNEQITNDNSIFASNLDFIGQLELTPHEHPAAANHSSTESDFDDYFMELELDFDE